MARKKDFGKGNSKTANELKFCENVVGKKIFDLITLLATKDNYFLFVQEQRKVIVKFHNSDCTGSILKLWNGVGE